MHLIRATDDYRIGEVPTPGFPLLLWEDMRSCYEANAFLRFYLQRAPIESHKSWDVIGRALYDFFGYLEANELRWDDVKRGDDSNLIAMYRKYCFGTEGHERNTVRVRVTYICSFYEFALKRGWIDKLPHTYEERRANRPEAFLAHVSAQSRKEVSSELPRKHKELPKFLSRDQAKALLKAATNPHHSIIIRLALQSGLRREELATFPVDYVFDPDLRDNSNRNVWVQLDPTDGTGMRTKGSRRREILLSRRLMKALWLYRKHHRGERARLSSSGHRAFFLNQAGDPWAGEGKGIEAMVRKLGAMVGVTTHPHMLRHTYATHTLHALRAGKLSVGIDPLVFLQNQLGHASIQTTMVYLHLANEHADNAVLAYDDELNDYTDGEHA